MSNQLKTVFFMALLTGLLVAVGNLIAGRQGAILFLLLAAGLNFFSYWYSDRIAILMTGSRPLSEAEAPELYAIVRDLCRRADLPMPAIYLTPSQQPNAFATGRNPHHAALAVTEGLLHLMNREELTGVLAHELAHIRNRDILISSIVAVIAGAISMLADVARWSFLWGGWGSRDEENNAGSALGSLIMIIVAPIAALLIQLAISRSREYQADESGALIAGSAHGLANALLKLDQAARMLPMEVNPSAAHMFIVNPLSGSAIAALFSTHPPIQERVRRLREMVIIQ